MIKVVVGRNAHRASGAVNQPQSWWKYVFDPGSKIFRGMGTAYFHYTYIRINLILFQFFRIMREYMFIGHLRSSLAMAICPTAIHPSLKGIFRGISMSNAFLRNPLEMRERSSRL